MSTNLQYKWSLWYDDFRDEFQPKEYDKNLYLIATFDSIESFWGTFNNVPKLNCIPKQSSFHLMKFGIKPLWYIFSVIIQREDKQNFQGSVTKVQISSAIQEDFWKEALIFFISLQFCEQYDEEKVNGISIVSKDGMAIFKIWSNCKEQPDDLINCIEQQIGKHIPNLKIKIMNSLSKFIILRVQECNELVKKFKKIIDKNQKDKNQ